MSSCRSMGLTAVVAITDGRFFLTSDETSFVLVSRFRMTRTRKQKISVVAKTKSRTVRSLLSAAVRASARAGLDVRDTQMGKPDCRRGQSLPIQLPLRSSERRDSLLVRTRPTPRSIKFGEGYLYGCCRRKLARCTLRFEPVYVLTRSLDS